ncbi:hypothetical protein GGX14DRAFT_149647 [Mycena pura]|uniref:Uncharacterized protein n=1 Tax=Mycena pura TaxID=153505 RepID=A0AAD6YNZ5_9AGAR|nr:hypothetical protein GGX14DRAFT_149647 [Mycena pura]
MNGGSGQACSTFWKSLAAAMHSCFSLVRILGLTTWARATTMNSTNSTQAVCSCNPRGCTSTRPHNRNRRRLSRTVSHRYRPHQTSRLRSRPRRHLHIIVRSEPSLLQFAHTLAPATLGDAPTLVLTPAVTVAFRVRCLTVPVCIRRLASAPDPAVICTDIVRSEPSLLQLAEPADFARAGFNCSRNEVGYIFCRFQRLC